VRLRPSVLATVVSGAPFVTEPLAGELHLHHAARHREAVRFLLERERLRQAPPRKAVEL
jgi:hypothetical protein